MHLTFFPPEVIALNEEVSQHPDLAEKLANQDKDFYVRLAEIAAHCQVALQGNYDQSDINHLCDVLTRKLKEKRTTIILPFAS